MHRTHSGLPRVRVSFPGTPTKSNPRPAPWAALLLLAGVLLVIGYSHLAGNIRISEQESSSKGRGRTVATAAVTALQTFTATIQPAAGLKQGTDADQLQQLQQGMDYGGDNGLIPRMLSQQPDGNSSIGVSFLQVQPVIKDAADAMSRKPAVHGLVEKSGMSDPLSWFSNYSDTRLDSFLSWRLNRTRAGGAGVATRDSYTCPAADHPPLPFPGCHVFINHQYKYIYIRSPKAASTSIVSVLGECDNVRTRGYNSSSCMAMHFYWPKAMLQSDALEKMWKDYFVFGFVRNPWQRAYSLYKYLHSSGCMSDDSLKDPNCRVPWTRFCNDPWSAAEELHDKGCIKRSKSYLYFHMTDQYHCLRTASGGWAVDFIGRVDEPNEDWAEVVRRLNENRVAGAPELPIGDLEQQNVRKSGEKDPYNAGSPAQAQCLDSVSRWYACDIESFGFAAAQQS